MVNGRITSRNCLFKKKKKRNSNYDSPFWSDDLSTCTLGLLERTEDMISLFISLVSPHFSDLLYGS